MRPSNKNVGVLAEEQDKKTLANVKGMLEDLVSASSTKKDLLIAARVMRLTRALNLYDSSFEPYKKVLKGANKHEIDFCELLEKQSPQ
jgi:hypothetical protein